jgi:hypothetical protein
MIKENIVVSWWDGFKWNSGDQLIAEVSDLRERLALAEALLREELESHKTSRQKEVFGQCLTVVENCDCSKCEKIRDALRGQQ